jgi:chromosome segregation ATPase
MLKKHEETEMAEDREIVSARLRATSSRIRGFVRDYSDAAEILDAAAAAAQRLPDLVAAVALHESNAAVAEEQAERQRAQLRQAEADHAAVVARITAEEQALRARIESDISVLTETRDGLEPKVSELRTELSNLHARVGVAVGGNNG